MQKLVIASDIHGSAYWCGKLLERFREESQGFEAGGVRLLLLGDVLYHGPRNDLPQGYAPKEVVPLLDAVRDRVFCVRGNCDGEVDQMVLSFPILADYAVFQLGGRTVYATHGHHWNAATPPPLCGGDILLYGHTHVPLCRAVPLPGKPEASFTALNPGSTSIPKEGSPHSFLVWQDGVFQWKELESGETWKRWEA